MSTEYGLPHQRTKPAFSYRLPCQHPVSPEMRTVILQKLREIEDKHDVRIIYACESGSRGWGFASPDSDYDVRFIYAHTRDWYCQLDSLSDPNWRDVIEEKINDDLDISGWDIRKVGHLVLKSNPVMMEWLHSPIVYSYTGGITHQLRELIGKTCTLEGAYHHYLGMAIRNYREHLNDEWIRYKKYLYVIRPLLCASWIYQGLGTPPMPFADVAAQTIDDPRLFDELARLLEKKMKAGESEHTARWHYVHAFINEEIARAKVREQFIRDRLNIQPRDDGERIRDVNKFLVETIRVLD